MGAVRRVRSGVPAVSAYPAENDLQPAVRHAPLATPPPTAGVQPRSRDQLSQARAVLNATFEGESEDHFEVRVTRLAYVFGWCGFHVRFSEATTRGLHLLVRDGHMDGYGWPDWVFVRVRDQRVLFCELKSEQGRQSRHQKHWQQLLQAAGQDFRVWRPSDWGEIVEALAA